MATMALRLLWQYAVPGIALLYALRLDRRDGKPDYVVPWMMFAAVLWVAWSIPIRSTRRTTSGWHADIPSSIWPWLALIGVILYRR
jgi:hypothetical protein